MLCVGNGTGAGIGGGNRHMQHGMSGMQPAGQSAYNGRPYMPGHNGGY